MESVALLITVVSVVGGGFYFTGRVTRAVEQLTVIAEDHEDRIRSLEHGAGGRRAG